MLLIPLGRSYLQDFKRGQNSQNKLTEKVKDHTHTQTQPGIFVFFQFPTSTFPAVLSQRL